MTHRRTEVHVQLRAWASGVYTVEAATELLIQAFDGRFTAPGWPWIHSTNDRTWIDFSAIPEHIGRLSRGEQGLLRIAASIGDDGTTVNIGDSLSRLDLPRLPLVLDAVAHAAGTPRDAQSTGQPDHSVPLKTTGSPRVGRPTAGQDTDGNSDRAGRLL